MATKYKIIGLVLIIGILSLVFVVTNYFNSNVDVNHFCQAIIDSNLEVAYDSTGSHFKAIIKKSEFVNLINNLVEKNGIIKNYSIAEVEDENARIVKFMDNSNVRFAIKLYYKKQPEKMKIYDIDLLQKDGRIPFRSYIDIDVIKGNSNAFMDLVQAREYSELETLILSDYIDDVTELRAFIEENEEYLNSYIYNFSIEKVYIIESTYDIAVKYLVNESTLNNFSMILVLDQIADYKIKGIEFDIDGAASFYGQEMFFPQEVYDRAFDSLQKLKFTDFVSNSTIDGVSKSNIPIKNVKGWLNSYFSLFDIDKKTLSNTAEVLPVLIDKDNYYVVRFSVSNFDEEDYYCDFHVLLNKSGQLVLKVSVK